MMSVADALTRAGIKRPLLIGGATTSAEHTAIKIAGRHGGPVVHVADASLVTAVCSDLLNPERQKTFAAELAAKQCKVREAYERSGPTPSVPLNEARTRPLEPKGSPPGAPRQLGVTSYPRVDTAAVAEIIDWTPFFVTWSLKGTFPKILTSAKYGTEARKLIDDARRELDDLIRHDRVHLRASAGIWPARRVVDDVRVFADASQTLALGDFHFLRDQAVRPSTDRCRSLADLVSDKPGDHLGAFVVSAGHELDAYAKSFKEKDPYREILIQALADRLAEGTAEWLHREVRRTLWAYAPDENLTVQQLIDEAYEGRRPAAGYPACPEHTEKALIWKLLDAGKSTDCSLTESFAMNPAASVSGLYFGHPGSIYFDVDCLQKDQVEDYARRKGWSVAEAEKWLAPVLGYRT